MGMTKGECLIASGSNYRVIIFIGLKPRQLAQRSAVLDTGAGCQFIHLNCILINKQNFTEHATGPKIFDASRNPLNIVGSVRLWILLGSHMIRKIYRLQISPHIIHSRLHIHKQKRISNTLPREAHSYEDYFESNTDDYPSIFKAMKSLQVEQGIPENSCNLRRIQKQDLISPV